MSRPRQVPRGRTYLITRRTSERRYFLRPSKLINQICEFCLAYAAWRTGMKLHGFSFLSDHFHLVATDAEARLPEFMHLLDGLIARCVNPLLGRSESFWAPGSYNAAHLADHTALVDKMEYAFNNPVGSLLVPTMKDWPGAFSTPAEMKRPPKLIKRPKVFFREDGPVPESVFLELSVPDSLEMSVEELGQLVKRREEERRREIESDGRGFLGRRQVLKQSPLGRPRTREQRGGIKPSVAAKDKSVRIHALQQLKSFLSAYREALERYVGGDRGIVFPYGTYGMRVRFGVMCSGP